MTGNPSWQPRHDDPLYILAMDHRESFGRTLFDVKDDDPDRAERAAIMSAKQLIFEGLQTALPAVTSGRAGVLVDERYGQNVIDAVKDGGQPLVLAVPVEASGHDWFTLEWGDRWLEHVETVKPDYAKVLVRDNPEFDAAQREGQFDRLAQVSRGLREAGVPLLYELLVPATDAQLDRVGRDAGIYDRDIRPGLVSKVIADNQAHGTWASSPTGHPDQSGAHGRGALGPGRFRRLHGPGRMDSACTRSVSLASTPGSVSGSTP